MQRTTMKRGYDERMPSIRITGEMDAQISEICDRYGLTPSQFVRACIDSGIDEVSKNGIERVLGESGQRLDGPISESDATPEARSE